MPQKHSIALLKVLLLVAAAFVGHAFLQHSGVIQSATNRLSLPMSWSQAAISPILSDGSADGPATSQLSAPYLSPFQQCYTNLTKPLTSAVNAAISPATQWIRHRISSGETLSKIWERYGSTSTAAAQAAHALRQASKEHAALRRGDEIELEIADGEIKTVRKENNDGSVIVLTGSSEQGYLSDLVPAQVTTVKRDVVGIINNSFAQSASNEEVPYGVVDDFVDLFGGRVEFRRAIQPGDTYTISYSERRTAEGKLLSTGPIESASIRSGKKLLVAIRHTSRDGKAHYYDENGQALGSYFLRYPVQFTRISSVFSTARLHPVLKVHRPHNGVDFAAPQGTPVRSVADGVVEKAGWVNGGGLTVQIRHNERWSTVYMHLSKINGISVGSRVSRAQVVGAVGMTGLATAPHLHFGLFDRGKYVDPLSAKLPQMTVAQPLPQEYLVAALRNVTAAHDSILSDVVAQAHSSKRSA